MTAITPPGIWRSAVSLSLKPRPEMMSDWKEPTAPFGIDAAVVMKARSQVCGSLKHWTSW